MGREFASAFDLALSLAARAAEFEHKLTSGSGPYRAEDMTDDAAVAAPVILGEIAIQLRRIADALASRADA